MKSKQRRRRSIRHMRASSGFNSPVAEETPVYGSAWIDNGLDTNMGNIVSSLSMLENTDSIVPNNLKELSANCKTLWLLLYSHLFLNLKQN